MSEESSRLPILEFGHMPTERDFTPFTFNPQTELFLNPALGYEAEGLSIAPNETYVRWFPSKHDPYKEYYEDVPETIVSVTQEHYLKLFKRGIGIAPHSYLLGTAPGSTTTALYTVTPSIEGVTPNQYQDPQHQDILANRIFPALVDYYQWVIQTGQHHFIQDLPHPLQYILHESEGGIIEPILVDLDPYVVRLEDGASSGNKDGYLILFSDITELHQFIEEDSDQSSLLTELQNIALAKITNI